MFKECVSLIVGKELTKQTHRSNEWWTLSVNNLMNQVFNWLAKEWHLKLSIKSMIRRLWDALAQKVRNDYCFQRNGSSDDKQKQVVGEKEWMTGGGMATTSCGPQFPLLSIFSFSHLQPPSHFCHFHPFPTPQFTSFHANLTAPTHCIIKLHRSHCH